MTKQIAFGSQQVLNVGNSRTYTITQADRDKYASFFLLTAATVTVTVIGGASLALVLAPNEEVILGEDITTIVSMVDNIVVFQYETK